MTVFIKKRTFVFIIFFLLFQGIITPLFSQAPWPTEKWPRSTPEEQQINPRQWNDLVRQIRHENECPQLHSQLNRLAKGWDRFYLNRPMVSKPGTRFQYDSGGVILMSAMLKNRTGMHVDAFAEKFLFDPLGIKKVRWIKNREGHPHTGGGLSLRPLDMAKLGLLYLRNGKWENKQVVPAWWVEESLKKHVTFSRLSRRRHTNYGYLWWIQEPDPSGSGKQDIYSARGHGGQFIFIIPEHNAGLQKPIDFLYSHILPAMHD